MPVADARADRAEGDLLPDGEVGRAADDAVLLAVADIDGGEAQAVGVGVGVDGGDGGDADLVAPVAGAFDGVDLEAGLGELFGEFVGGRRTSTYSRSQLREMRIVSS